MWAGYGTNNYQVWEQADINRECPTFLEQSLTIDCYWKSKIEMTSHYTISDTELSWQSHIRQYWKMLKAQWIWKFRFLITFFYESVVLESFLSVCEVVPSL